MRRTNLLALILLLLLCAVSQGSFKFVAWADNRPLQEANRIRFVYMLQEMNDIVGSEPLFHVVPGDYDYTYMTNDDIRDFSDITTWYSAPGNHDTDDLTAPNYVLDVPGGLDGDPQARFLFLNEYKCPDGVKNCNCSEGRVCSHALTWLYSECLPTPGRFPIFVVGHEPAFPSYSHVGDSLDKYTEERDAFWAFLEQYGATYICGHTHYYSTYSSGGATQIDVGNAGNPRETNQTFVDVTVTDTYVIFTTYQGTWNVDEGYGVPFEITETWTIEIPTLPDYFDYVVNSDIPVGGTIVGYYTDTQSSNNVCEEITERQSGGKPSNRYSYLEHKWAINVTGGDTVTFNVEAYKTPSGDGDDFMFAYSTDDYSYRDMVYVTKTSDDDTVQSYPLPAYISGTVYIRVKDTDQTQGHNSLDTIYIDHMYIRSEGEGTPDTLPPAPNPMTWAEPPHATGSTSISMTATTASDPSGVEYYFDCTTAGGGHNSGWQDSEIYEDTDLSPGTTYTYQVKARDKSAEQLETGWSTPKVSATTTESGDGTMHVDDIAMDFKVAGPNRSGIATIWIKDTSGTNVKGAKVYGTWSCPGLVDEAASGITGPDGKVKLQLSKIKSAGTFTFTVTNVAKSEWTYDPTANIEDSDSIIVP